MIRQTNQQKKEQPHPCPCEPKALSAACHRQWRHLGIGELSGRFGGEQAHRMTWCAGSWSVCVVHLAQVVCPHGNGCVIGHELSEE